MELKSSIAQLEAAKDNPYALALATLDIVLAAHDANLKPALEAAAVPHWFDDRILQALLEETGACEGDCFDQLLQLTVVEPFHAHKAYNVHEVSRLALRSRLAEEQPDRFRKLSRLSAALFQGHEWPHAVERIYHRLTADPDQGISELASTLYEWRRAKKREPMQALAGVLDELRGRGLLAARAQGHALLALGQIRMEQIDIGEHEKMAREAVELLEASGDAVGLSDAYSLLGRVLLELGHSGEALSAYEAARTRLDQGAADDPLLESKRADLHQRVGRALQECGRIAEAQAEFEACLEHRESLRRMDPDNGLSRYDEAVAQADVADALMPTSQFAEAEAHYIKALETLRALRAQKQGPDDVEEDIGRLHQRLGDLLRDRGQTDGALKEYETSEAIFEKLIISEPDNFAFKSDLSYTHRRMALLHAAWKQLDPGVERLKMANQILDDLIERDPSNPRWKYDLASLKISLSDIEDDKGNIVDAVTILVESIDLLKALSEEDPERVSWKLTLTAAQENLAAILKRIVPALEDNERKGSTILQMIQTYAEVAKVRSKLVERDPENIEWKRALAYTRGNFASSIQSMAKEIEAGLDLKLGEEWTVATMRDKALQLYILANTALYELSQHLPQDVGLKRSIIFVITGIAVILNSLGRREECLTFYHVALPRARELAELDAKNPRWSQDVATIEGVIAEMEGEGVEAADFKEVVANLLK